jgi:hypothetical protein
MKHYLNLTVLLATLLSCALAWGQQSLADAARTAKGEKKPATKKVYTNEDFEGSALVTPAVEKAPADSGEVATVKPAKEETADAKAAPRNTVAKTDNKPAPMTAANVESWNNKIDSQKKAVADIDRELNLMEREHQVKVATYYADAGNQLRDSKKWFEDEKKYEDEHTAKQKDVANAKQKLTDLQEEARKAGVPASAVD